MCDHLSFLRATTTSTTAPTPSHERRGAAPSQVVSGRCAVMLKGHQVGSLELQGLDLCDMSESEARLEAACVSP